MSTIDPREPEITWEAAGRYLAFLRRELAEIPDWHPQHQRYRESLQTLIMSRALHRVAKKCQERPAHAPDTPAAEEGSRARAQDEPAADTLRYDGFRIWSALPWAVRERILLEALGDERLPLADITARIDATRDDWLIDVTMVRPLATRMLHAREIARVAEYWPTGGFRRHIYHRRTSICGTIADLERELQRDDRSGAEGEEGHGA